MPPERWSPDDPREWLNRAGSNLVRARTVLPGVYLEDLCFDAQQSAEKAIKAVLIARGVDFPLSHDLAHLLTILEQRAGHERRTLIVRGPYCAGRSTVCCLSIPRDPLPVLVAGDEPGVFLYATFLIPDPYQKPHHRPRPSIAPSTADRNPLLSRRPVASPSKNQPLPIYRTLGT
jgi:hypothetical protein